MSMNLKLVLGILGNATAMALFFSPMPTFMTIYREKSTQEFSGLPYVFTLFNCMLWVLYGLPIVRPNSVLILTINGFGTALETIYIGVFLKYSSPEKKVWMLRLVLAVLLTQSIVVIVTVLALHSLYTRQLVAGILCVLGGLAMYASPVSILGLVVRTRNVQYMPFLVLFFNFINSCMWIAYSFVTKDIFVALPNGLGCLFSIAQLGIYATYKNATPVCEVGDLDHTDQKTVETEYHSMQKRLVDDEIRSTTTNMCGAEKTQLENSQHFTTP